MVSGGVAKEKDTGSSSPPVRDSMYILEGHVFHSTLNL